MSGKRVFVIAEAGVNHNGDISLAKELVDIAVTAGADAVKFQTWKTELVVSKTVKMADYQIENTGIEESQFDMLKRLELTYNEFIELKEYCDKKNIMFLSTADEEESADFLNDLQEIFKVGSGELTNVPLLRLLASYDKDIILSTGMSSFQDIDFALEILMNSGLDKDKITLLHVTTQYPTPMNEVNLLAMLSIRERYGVKVGCSDHTMGIEVPIAAVALGACVIEKHFTLDRDMKGPDHKASLNPQELKNMISSVRNIEIALGNGNKEPTISELRNKEVVVRGIVAIKNIAKGEIFTSENIGLRRVKGGLSPKKWDKIIDSISKKKYKEGEII